MVELLAVITSFVKHAGYVGIFIMTFIESTFIPIPAEFTMIPAGYLVDNDELDFTLVMVSSMLGTLSGSWVSYFIAAKYGRNLVEKYGKYLFISNQKFEKMEEYFDKHGAAATFTGRLIPGLRHYISFPAGLARMKLKVFFIYTALGGGIWMFILLMLGYFIGEKQELIEEYLENIQIVLITIISMFIAWCAYKAHQRKKEKN
jgi:membrane protein DedA with SNARE-associated domain